MLLLVIIWDNIDLKGFIGGGALVSLILWFLNAAKDRKKDKVGNENTEAQTKKTEAEAAKLKAEAEVTVATSALEIANRISQDYLALKVNFEKATEELEKARKDIRDLSDKLADSINKLNGELQSAMLRDKEIEELRDELRKLKEHD